jgi:hypothetical protein
VVVSFLELHAVLTKVSEQWWRVLFTSHHHWLRVSSRTATDEGTKTSGSRMSSSSLSPYAGGDLQNNQKRSKQLILVFSFLFTDLFTTFSFFGSTSRRVGLLWVSSSSPLLRVAGPAIVEEAAATLMIFTPVGCRGGWGLLLEEEGIVARGVGHHCGMKKSGRSGGVGSQWKRMRLVSGHCSGHYY